MAQTYEATCDYVVIGSGAGGGTVAARLAEAGMQVVLLEAGGDPRQPEPGAAADPRLPADYDVPAFHSFASENPAMSWDFFVEHYTDSARQSRDPKRQPQGVFYPRAGTLGGCTAHNAMIFLRPHDSDWDGIAALTGDPSWRAEAMRRYVGILEQCHHRPGWRLPEKIGIDPTGHGWDGWLPTERAMPPQIFRDNPLLATVLQTVFAVTEADARPFESVLQLFEGRADPNDERLVRANAEGVCYTPMTTRGHRRYGTRERLREVAAKYPDRLRLELDALATEILFDDDKRAIGVAYRKGRHLYRADPGATGEAGAPCRIHARREIILAGGAFNTPQLLMLSGIGPRAELERHGVTVRLDLGGVGQNLQDRYEIGVVNRTAHPWKVLDGACFEAGDPLYEEWDRRGSGMYTSNGAAIALRHRSAPAQPVPDLFAMAFLARFTGYFPGYSRDIAAHHDYLSWAVLKAHTLNRAGSVTLRSADPRDTPEINFRYFDEGSDSEGADLQAVIEGIRFIRRLTQLLKDKGLIIAEELPGDALQSDAELAEYIRDNAWGHHACGTAAIGPREEGGVLDSRFRVHGTSGLRVVDASIFPRIPGFFIAGPIYMAAEKAAEVIIADAAP